MGEQVIDVTSEEYALDLAKKMRVMATSGMLVNFHLMPSDMLLIAQALEARPKVLKTLDEVRTIHATMQNQHTEYQLQVKKAKDSQDNLVRVNMISAWILASVLMWGVLHFSVQLIAATFGW